MPLLKTVLGDAPALLTVAIFFGVWVLLWLPIAIPLAIALKWQPPQPITSAQKLPLLASLYVLAPLVLWAIASAREESFADYGLPWRGTVLTSLAIGLIAGVISLGGLFALQWQLGWVHWRPGLTQEDQTEVAQNTSVAATLLSTLLLGIWVSLTEEVIFRGFVVNQLQSGYSPWVAAAIASLIFAVLHLVWEGVEQLPQLPGLWLLGVVLVLARWADGGHLGLAWGLHAGWIWAIANLDTLRFSNTPQSPGWLTGSTSKPLSGLIGILFLLVVGAILYCG